MTRIFDVFFDLRLNKRLNKQSWSHAIHSPSQCNVEWKRQSVCRVLYIHKAGKQSSGPRRRYWVHNFQTPLKHITHNNGSNPASTTFTHVLIYNCANISSTSVRFPSQIKAIKSDVTNESPISDCLPDLHTSTLPAMASLRSMQNTEKRCNSTPLVVRWFIYIFRWNKNGRTADKRTAKMLGNGERWS